MCINFVFDIQIVGNHTTKIISVYLRNITTLVLDNMHSFSILLIVIMLIFLIDYIIGCHVYHDKGEQGNKTLLCYYYVFIHMLCVYFNIFN